MSYTERAKSDVFPRPDQMVMWSNTRRTYPVLQVDGTFAFDDGTCSVSGLLITAFSPSQMVMWSENNRHVMSAEQCKTLTEDCADRNLDVLDPTLAELWLGLEEATQS